MRRALWSAACGTKSNDMSGDFVSHVAGAMRASLGGLGIVQITKTLFKRCASNRCIFLTV